MGFFNDFKEDLSQAVEDDPNAVPVPEDISPDADLPEEFVIPDSIQEEFSIPDALQEGGNDLLTEGTGDLPLPDLMDEAALQETEPNIETGGDNSVSKAESIAEETVEEAAAAAEAEAPVPVGDVEIPELAEGPVSEESGSIPQGMIIYGDIVSDGSLDVIGTVNGNIHIRGKLNISGTIMGNSKSSEIFADSAKITGEVLSDGAVKVGQDSVILGNISATSAVIAGAVKGDIDRP